ncbi:MAG: hypothetical protein HQL14_04895 [Candidatus Omnitrophica bacterium]|nr:hypothetical protein [Candidatus Omnitrophota bacterium]
MKTTPWIFILTILIGLTFIVANPVLASTTWYVRLDGGTPTQCNGTTNAAYPGSGTGVACALNHPAWVLGTNGNSGLMAGGDTLVIDDTDHSTGAQAQYMIGYGMPNTVGANCNLYSPYLCTLNTIPSGPNPANPTTVAGISYNTGCAAKPQLWGTESVQQVLNVSGASNVAVQCLELTDHSNCGFRVGSPVCAENYNSGTSSGTYARNGILGASGMTNLIFKNLDVHGFSNRGLLLGGVNGITFSYVNMDGNYQSNWDGDVGEANNASYNSGTILLDHVKNRFAGCSEAYPRSSSFNTADYSNCTDQNDNPPGYGDGIGMYNTGGDWVVTDSEISHNTQDGLDILYHDGTGSVTIQRSLFEGNDGNQLKMTAGGIDIENSVIISNCNYLQNNNKVKNTNSWSSCRAGGDATVLSVAQGGTYKILNSTIYSDGNSDVMFVDRVGTCNGTEKYTFRNNINVGNGSSSLYISGLGGSCSTPPLDTDYSIINNVSSSFCPSGAHNKCNTNPGWLSSISQSADSNVPNIALASSSPAVGAGLVIAGISTSDYSSKDRGGSAWDIGALQYSTSGPAPTGSLPTITITSPSNQTTLAASSNITITATASETGGTIATVSFYNGSTLLGQSSTSPYSYTWTNVPAGSYTLTAKATDAKASTTTSNPVMITVAAASAPVVAITSPANQSSFAAGSNINITTAASETNGTIATVSFYYNGSTLLGTSSASPFNYIVSNVPAGTYTVTAVATDIKGVSTTSSPVTVTVTTPSTPVVAITGPANQSTVTAGSNINVTATASEANGTIVSVNFYNGSTLLGTSSVSPYSYNWSNVPAGTYTLTAKATDANSVSTTSGAITVTVTAAPASKPVVAITSPSNQSTFTAGSSGSITASASETNGTIAQVSFYYNGTNLLGTSTVSPYSYAVSNIPAGTYTLTAIATDSKGISTTSSPITVTITASAPATPVVAITGPANQSTFTAGSSISITASASEINGSIAKVYFYTDSTLIGTSSASSCNFTWRNVSSGTHRLTAKATDTNGVSTTSSPVTITVTTSSRRKW